jgi:polyisoprenoid-binding protein YceI
MLGCSASETKKDSATAPKPADEKIVVAEKTDTPDAEKEEVPFEEQEGTKYVISANDDSVITFTGYKPLGSQVGGFSEFNGLVIVPDDDLAKLKVKAVVDMVNFYTVEPVLKDVLADKDFFNTSSYPTATFISTSVTKSEDKENHYVVKGKFELIGITKEFAFPATIKKTDKGLSIIADFKLNRENWGMNKSWKDSAIYDEVDINMELLAPLKK